MARRVVEPMHDEHVNVTPLIDVVMCLIIFFLLVGQMAKDEAAGEITIPKALTAQEMVDSEGRLIVNVIAKSNPTGDPDHPTMKIGTVSPDVIIRRQLVPQSKLTDYLRKEKFENKDLRLVIRADGILSYEHIAPILISCAQADIRSINFATQQGTPEGNSPSSGQ
jgi:biopolymer transport protein ExbD